MLDALRSVELESVGLAPFALQRRGIYDPDFLDVSGASLRDEQEPCLLPGHLIDWCPGLHDPLSPLAWTSRTARVGGTFTGNRSSACVWSGTDKSFGWKIPNEQSTQWRELLWLSLVVHRSTALDAGPPSAAYVIAAHHAYSTGP